MNVQPGYNAQPQSKPAPAIKAITTGDGAGTRDLAIKAVRTGKEMHAAEMQGVKISVGEEQLIKAIDRAIKVLEGPTTTFEMKMHEQTKTVIVKVINKETGELIREIPPEKTLDLVVKMMEIAGILVDEKV